MSDCSFLLECLDDNPVAVYLMVEAMHHVPDDIFVPSGSLPPDSGIARGGPWHPTLLLNVFSPINLRCYVLLVCK